jgi:HEAT repeat protein
VIEVEKLAQVVDDMIVQHDYPGFEPRALKLGLPQEIEGLSAKTFGAALGHESIYVRLAALRWLQERPGVAKSYLNAIAGLLDNGDPYVRLESARTFQRIGSVDPEFVLKICRLLKDDNADVRKAAAKAIGKLGSKLKQPNQEILDALNEATTDKDPEVRMKVQKAVRLI